MFPIPLMVIMYQTVTVVRVKSLDIPDHFTLAICPTETQLLLHACSYELKYSETSLNCSCLLCIHWVTGITFEVGEKIFR